MIGEALAEVGLRADQEATVESLGAEVEPLQALVDQAESEILRTLADQVKADRIDPLTLEPEVQAYAAARLSASTTLRSTLEELHALLNPDQRADFADALESRLHEAIAATTCGEMLARFAERLGLSEAQNQKLDDSIQQMMPALRAERRGLHNAIEGFRGDSFSIEQHMPKHEVLAKARRRAERIIALTESLMNTLDAGQREKLAARIDEAAHARGDEMSDEPHARGHLGIATDHLWAAGRVVRGPFGGVRGGVVVGGSAGFYGNRARAYPVAAGWGWGW